VFAALVLAESWEGWTPAGVAGLAPFAAGLIGGRWAALLVLFLLVCAFVGSGVTGALIDGTLFEPNPDDADNKTNAQIAIFGLVLGLLAAVPATLCVAVGVLASGVARRRSVGRRAGPAAARRGRWTLERIVIVVVLVLSLSPPRWRCCAPRRRPAVTNPPRPPAREAPGSTPTG